MIRRTACLLLGLLLLAPAAHAQVQDYTDYKTEGRYKELAQYIATTYYDKVLQHPEVAKALRALTGPYYERMSNLVDVAPIRYEPKGDIVLEGFTTRAPYNSPEHEKVMIVINWGTLYMHAALRTPTETLIFADDDYMDELLEPLSFFVRNKEASSLRGRARSETWFRFLDYRRNGDPQIWPARKAN